MNARRGLEHLGARAGRGSRPEELPGLSRGSPQPPLARGAPHTPLTTLPQPPHLRLCLLAPAGRSGALRTPGAPICALQIPRNVKLGAEGSREGRQKLGASHPLGNLRSFPVLRGPVGTQTPTPHPEGTSCSVYVCISIYTSVFPGLPPSLGFKSQGVFVQVTPTRSTPLPYPQLCLPTSQDLLCCFAWLCSYGESGNPAVPKASPPRAGRQRRGQTGCRRGREGPEKAVTLQSAKWPCWQVRASWPPVIVSEGADGVQPSRHCPWNQQKTSYLSPQPLLTMTNSDNYGMGLSLWKPFPNYSSFDSHNTSVGSPGWELSSPVYK